MTNTYEDHIRTLQAHGARIATPDGGMELTTDFYLEAVRACGKKGCMAITYELILPGIEEEMGLAIWKDGKVFSGSMRSICDCLATW